MKKILGLDIGTNSIGGALIELDTENYGQSGKIIWTGSRIVPVDGDSLQKFESGGQVETKAANRRQKRGTRRLKHRYKLRRKRLVNTLKVLGWLPDNFPTDFKIAKKNGIEFKMKDYLPFIDTTIQEAAKAFKVEQNKKGEVNLSEDWIVYYLRKKALTEKIELFELARILYILNQRRGFKSSRKDLKDETSIIPYEEFKKMTENEEFVDIDGKTLETKFVEVTKIKKIEQVDEEKDKNGKFTFKIHPESERIEPWDEKLKKKPDWINESKRLLVTQKTRKSGDKYKIEQLKPQVPSDDDWNLAMVSLDEEIESSNKKVGEFFFDKLVKDKNYLIRQQVVKRTRYEKELKAIWDKQKEFHSELTSKEKLEEIAKLLYPPKIDENGKEYEKQPDLKVAKWKEITNSSLLDVISNDIIYYQRDLKSQKNLIDECRYEKKPSYINKNNEQITPGYKVAPKSCPEFQEFRIWQDIHNMRVIRLEDDILGKIDVDETHFLTPEKKAELFALMDSKEEVKENALLKVIDKSFSHKTHRISLFANRKTLKGNETKELFRKIFNKYDFDGEYLIKDKFQLLWHILYSINGKDAEKGIKKALINPKNGFGKLPEEVIKHLSEKTREFPKQYAAYSSKAIKKLLPLMRCGKYWNKQNFSIQLRERIDKFIDGEYDESIDDKTRKRILDFGLTEFEKYQGLPLWLASYIVYGRHSERESDYKFKTWDEIDVAKLIPNNSLRNPIVEQVVRETMEVVKEVWKLYGRPDEIHIEMGRDLKNNTEQRKRISENQTKNFNEKQQVKKLLQELKEGNPESPIDIEKFRIWKQNGGVEADIKFKELFDSKNLFVKGADIQKYRLWAEQKHKSPYTGKQIPLSKLFTEEYEKEHIIPRSKLKYDAMVNFVICESVVNKFKADRLAMEMIDTDGGREHIHNGEKFELLSKEEYINNCSNFEFRKRKNLLAEEIPDGFIERQLNDTRHITKKLGELLWPVANDKEGLVFTIGSITNDLKQQWGLNTEWKKLIKPRFERLGKILGEELIVEDGNKFHLNPPDDKVNLKRIDHRHHAMDALIIAATTRAHINYLNALNSHDEKQKWKYVAKERVRDFHLPWADFSKDVKNELSKVIISHKYNNRVLRTPHNRYWKWEQQTDGNWKKVLKNQKANDKWKSVKLAMFGENPRGSILLKEPKYIKVIDAVNVQLERMKGKMDEKNNPRNYIYNKHARKQIKELAEQFKGDLDAIKKHLKKNKLTDEKGKPVDKVEIAFYNEYAAKRTTLDDTFTDKKIKDSIPYAKRTIERWEEWEKKNVVIRKKEGKKIKVQFPKDTKKWPLAFLLYKHLNEKDENGKLKYNGPKEAFKGEGLEDLFKKAGRLIKKITTYESKSNPIKLYDGIWETAAGGNIYFVIQENIETKERDFYSVPLYSSEDFYRTEKYGAINRLLKKEPIVDKRDGWKNILLKVGDLVYVPTPDEIEHHRNKNMDWVNDIDWNGKDKERVFERAYKMVSCTDKKCQFIPHNIAKGLIDNNELGSGNKSEKAWDGNIVYTSNSKGKITRQDTGSSIKNVCFLIKVDRLGNIIKVDGKEITPTGKIEKI
ncbi:MAG: hypothetical protein H6587_10810 [Flavobacteriales bacterium]|nr:hypothetical protein [Flavobacteriales bacterium]MCB9365051.1 hypothetical protein [Flavobacteriales bacterium]